MVCARVRAIMHSLTLVHYRYVHVHNHGISKTNLNLNINLDETIKNVPFIKGQLLFACFLCIMPI